VDVIEGRGPHPLVVMSYVQRLPDTSMTAALAAGDKKHFGWGVDRHLAADTFDAINANTRATGSWKKGKAPNFPTWPRPSDKKKKEKPRSLGDLYKQFTRG
jgi:hypothetical protein